jgi:predicted RNA-binding protein with PUA-like domain
MTNQYWLVKSEPETYGWEDLRRDRKTDWTGVRNFAARNHLKAMRRGDRVLFYETGGVKAVVGIAQVTKPAFPDETADAPGWVAVELKPENALPAPVNLAQVKADRTLAGMALVKQPRLSVQPVTPAEFERILMLGTPE